MTLEYDEDLNYFREVSKRYGSDNFLIITFSPKTGDLFEDHNLETLGDISNQLRDINGIENTISMLDVPLLYSPKISISDLDQPLKTILDKA